MDSNVSFLLENTPALLWGLLNTVLFCSIGTSFGLVLGTAIALARRSEYRAARYPVVVFVEVFRNTPFLVQAFLVYFGLAEFGWNLDASVCGTIVLTLYASANFSESIGSAISSVPTGQVEAARALGFKYLFIVFRITLPQTTGYLVPALTNQIIGLIKDSAALSVITVPEIAMAAQLVVGETFEPVQTYAIVALLYWATTSLLVFGLTRIERKNGKWSLPASRAKIPQTLEPEVER